jgi:excisionase family DNA binding protein
VSEDLKRLLTASQVSELAAVGKRTVLRWAERGELEVVQLGPRLRRFDERAVRRFLDARRRGGQAGEESAAP